MIFTAITKEALNFSKGKIIGKDRYEFHEGAHKAQSRHQEINEGQIWNTEEELSKHVYRLF